MLAGTAESGGKDALRVTGVPSGGTAAGVSAALSGAGASGWAAASGLVSTSSAAA